MDAQFFEEKFRRIEMFLAATTSTVDVNLISDMSQLLSLYLEFIDSNIEFINNELPSNFVQKYNDNLLNSPILSEIEELRVSVLSRVNALVAVSQDSGILQEYTDEYDDDDDEYGVDEEYVDEKVDGENNG